MSFPRYPKYKESGVEWLGQVPEHWEVKPLWSLFRFSKGLTITKEDLLDEGLPCVNYGEIHSKYGVHLDPDKHPLKCVDQSWLEKQADALIRKGDFVFADTSEDLEGSGNFTCLINGDPIFAGYHTIIARPRHDLSSSFFAHEFHSQSFRSQVQKRVKGIKVFSITQGLLKGICCWQPPLAEQTAIADFLDRETAKIDGLIAEQERLIELLKEKRQAAISHAVTKGLNPDAPMKDSGIEWLGQVPAHWEVTPIKVVSKLFGRIGYRGYTTADIVEEGEGAITMSPSNMSDGIVSVEKSTYISWEKYNESPEIMVMPGDVVMVKTGSTFGKVAFVTEVNHPTTINPQLVLFKRITCLPRFLFLVLNTAEVQALIEVNNSGSTIPTMSQEVIGNFRFGLPPIREQEAVVKFVDGQLLKMETLTAEAQKAITLLQERRSALISAAVTGQIDVRSIHHQEAE
jgi:type I restriction enzyme S subunit